MACILGRIASIQFAIDEQSRGEWILARVTGFGGCRMVVGGNRFVLRDGASARLRTGIDFTQRLERRFRPSFGRGFVIEIALGARHDPFRAELLESLVKFSARSAKIRV